MAVEMNFCRRCGAPLTQQKGVAYKCANGHEIFKYVSTTAIVILINEKDEVLLTERALEPKKGTLDFPGGFTDGAESFEDAIARELREEVGFEPGRDYGELSLLLSSPFEYEYDGEMTEGICVVFYGDLKTGTLPEARDDVTNAQLVNLYDIDMSKFGFEILEKAVLKMRKIRS